MKVELGFPIKQLSGSDGDTGGRVYFQSNGVNQSRAYVTPNNPETANQITVRSALTACAQNFKTLTNTQRAGWATYAQLDPIKVFGEDVTLQDIACYVRSDFYNYLKGATHLTTAPTAKAGFAASAIDTVAYVTGTTTLSFDITHNGTAPNGYWVVRVTGALASAQRHAKASDFRLAAGPNQFSIPTLAASAQTFSTSIPVFSWADNDWMEIEVTPLSLAWGLGSPFKWRGQITVT